MIKAIALLLLTLVANAAEKQIFTRFDGYMVRNSTDKDINVITVSGKTRTGPVYISPGSGKTEGFGPIKLEDGLSLVVDHEGGYRKEFHFTPNIKSITEQGTSVTLVFIVMNDDTVKMAYDITKDKQNRGVRLIVGEDPQETKQRNLNEDLVHYSGWGTIAQVKSAFDSGAKIDSVNDFGMTALMMAVANNKVDTIRYLMSKNPGMSFRNGAGKTVIDLAATDEIRALLRR